MSQRVLITAGASGIGLEIARGFTQAGASVFVCDIDRDGLEAVAREIPGLVTGLCDVSDRPATERMVGEAVAFLGGLDVLVNNAGISGPTASVEDMEPDAWDEVLKVDLTGTFNVSRQAIPHLKASGSGAILNMSSLAGRFGYPNRSPYCAAKWGIIGLTKTLSIELGAYGIRVNAILPGAVDGPRIRKVFEGRAEMSGRSSEGERDSMLSIQSIKRLVEPKDVAALCVFLASDAGKCISGQAIPIDCDAQKAS